MMPDAAGRTNQELRTATKWPTHAKTLRRQESARSGLLVPTSNSNSQLELPPSGGLSAIAATRHQPLSHSDNSC